MPRLAKLFVPSVQITSDFRELHDDSDLDSVDMPPDPKREFFDTLSSTGLLERNEPSQSSRLNETALLELCDAVRTSLLEERTLGPRADETMKFLRAVVKDECGTTPIMELTTIQNVHVDKLLSEMLGFENHQMATQLQSRIYASTAERLQRLWTARFREKYFSIDQGRCLSLSKTGSLKDVVLNNAAEDYWQLWQAKVILELEEITCEPGHWWLNLACAHRDGIVGSIRETPTKSMYGVAALPLMTGREEVFSPTGDVRYLREAKISETHVSLISRVGFQIRILRGHRLRSPLAPKAGVRYDGLYIIRQYSHKRNPKTGLHRVVLTLERVADQRPIQELTKIPRPSQLDDWQVFEKHEGEMIRQKRGEQCFMDWKLARAEERMEQKQWQRAFEIGTALAMAKLSRYSYATARDAGTREQVE